MLSPQQFRRRIKGRVLTAYPTAASVLPAFLISKHIVESTGAHDGMHVAIISSVVMVVGIAAGAAYEKWIRSKEEKET
ncbi:MAG: hypothetical protein KC483_11330 [Nitrosarchaeum sp.]|nr:hypothetical protein [Nitrosarchaeum sp.]